MRPDLEEGRSNLAPRRSAARCLPECLLSLSRQAKWLWLTPCLVMAALSSSAAEHCTTEAVHGALRGYDLATAQQVLHLCRREAPAVADSGRRELEGRAALVVAELHRIDFESTAESERVRRRALGAQIDTAADEGLAALEGLPETSERRRLEADLLATKIRSDFRAKKYGAEMKAAADRALDLDPDNAHAIVSRAKPFLFAEARRGGDLEEAVQLLSEALALEPTLESALLLRALALEKQGKTAASRQDLQAALEANPGCRPAAERLQNQD